MNFLGSLVAFLGGAEIERETRYDALAPISAGRILGSSGREPHHQQAVDEAHDCDKPPRLGRAGDIARLRRYLRLRHRRTPWPLPA